MIKKHINIIVSLPTAGVSVYHSVVVLKWTISSYPVFPSALLVNFLGTCYVSFKIFNRRSVLKQTYMSILYANAWFPYLIRFSLSVKKSWSVSSSQNFQYITQKYSYEKQLQGKKSISSMLCIPKNQLHLSQRATEKYMHRKVLKCLYFIRMYHIKILLMMQQIDWQL